MKLRSSSLRFAAFAAVVAMAAASQATWYTWKGTDTNYAGIGSWFNQDTNEYVSYIPGADDNVQISRYQGNSSLVLDQDRTHYSGQIQEVDLDLASHAYNFSYVLDSYSATIHDGSLYAWVFNVYDGGAGPTSVSNVQGSFSGLNVYDGSSLELHSSNFTGDGFGVVNTDNTSLTLDGSTLNAHYGQLANATIGFGSSINVDAEGSTDVYATSLTTYSGQIDLEGSLQTNGALMGAGRTENDPRTNGSMFVGLNGSWTDTGTATVSLGFAGDFALDIQGGHVNLGNVNIGEGRANADGVTGTDGSGSVRVGLGGSFSAKQVMLGGWSRNGAVATGSGSISIDGGSSFTADGIQGVDEWQLGRGSASITIDEGSTFHSGYLVGGAINLDVNSGIDFSLDVKGGSAYSGQTLDLIGSAGKTVTASFSGYGTTLDVGKIGAYNGGSFTIDGISSLRTSQLEVGQQQTTIASNGFIRNTDIHVDSVEGFGNLIMAHDGTFTIDHSNITVADGQDLKFIVGGYAGRDAYMNLSSVGYNGFGSITVNADPTNPGAARLAIDGSSLNFNYGTLNGDVYNSTVSIGDVGQGQAVITNSNIEAFRFRTGQANTGNADVEIHNSAITAHSDLMTNANPGGIMVGVNGASKVEIFNSSLNAQKIYIGANGTLKGDGWLNGDSLLNPHTNVENHGTISPGHSPGRLNIDGDLSLTSTSILEMEVDLSDPSRYDQILTSGTVSLGGTFHLIALGSGSFDPNRSYTFLTAGQFNGSFSNILIDPAFGIDASRFSFNGGTFGINPAPVPEPASLLALGAGLVTLVRRKARTAS